MSRLRRVCSMAAAVGLAAPLPSLQAMAREVEGAPARAAISGPRVAQLGRSSGGSPASARPSGGGSSGGVVNSGPPASPASPSTSAPASQLGAPAPQAPAIAPLSPQLPSQFATGGGTAPGNLALSPGRTQGSPSEQTPSAPGGGGKTLAACLGFWEKATHMTKFEWREACKRTMQDYPTVR